MARSGSPLSGAAEPGESSHSALQPYTTPGHCVYLPATSPEIKSEQFSTDSADLYQSFFVWNLQIVVNKT